MSVYISRQRTAAMLPYVYVFCLQQHISYHALASIDKIIRYYPCKGLRYGWGLVINGRNSFTNRSLTVVGSLLVLQLYYLYVGVSEICTIVYTYCQ